MLLFFVSSSGSQLLFLTPALTQRVPSLFDPLPQQLDSSPSFQEEDPAGWHPNRTQCLTGNPEMKDAVLRRELSQDPEKLAELSSGEEDEWERKRSLSQRR